MLHFVQMLDYYNLLTIIKTLACAFCLSNEYGNDTIITYLIGLSMHLQENVTMHSHSL